MSSRFADLEIDGVQYPTSEQARVEPAKSVFDGVFDPLRHNGVIIVEFGASTDGQLVCLFYTVGGQRLVSTYEGPKGQWNEHPEEFVPLGVVDEFGVKVDAVVDTTVTRMLADVILNPWKWRPRVVVRIIQLRCTQCNELLETDEEKNLGVHRACGLIAQGGECVRETEPHEEAD